MRNPVGGWLALVLFFGLTARGAGGDREAALAVLDKAVAAHGGEQALSKTRQVSRSATGLMYQFGDKGVPFKDESVFQLPDRLRSSLELQDPQGKLFLIVVVNGEIGWQSNGGMTTELPKGQLSELREEAYVLWLQTLLPLKQDAAFELAPAPDVTVEGKLATGMKVNRKGHAEAKLYFDKGTGLLVKIERRAHEAGITLDKEYVFSDHREFEGVKLPTKQADFINRKKFNEVTAYSYKFLRRVDESTFGKP